MAGELSLAFLAGIASFISPCCLPMVPMYLSYLAGIAGGERTPGPGGPRGSRWLVLRHAACFVVGLALVFVALGASASVLGAVLRSHRLLVRHVAGLVIVMFGLHTAGIVRLGWLQREWRPRVVPRGNGGVARSALLGAAFGAGWTPCIEPMLGSILLLGSTTATLGQGVVLLLAYAAGLRIPFLVAAAAMGGATDLLRRLGRHYRLITWLSGALLVAMGVLVYEGTFAQLSRYFLFGV